MKKTLILVLFSIISIFCLYFLFYEKRDNNILEIYIFNLKSGNSVFVRTPKDHRLIFGTGSSQEILRYVTSILPFYNMSIDTAIVQDLNDKNNILFSELFERFKIKNLVLPQIYSKQFDISSSSIIFNILDKYFKNKDTFIKYVKSNDEIYKEEDMVISALFPTVLDDFKYSKSSPPNISWKIEYGNTAMFFLGKSTKKIQKYIASNIATSTRDNNTLITYTNDKITSISREFIEKMNINSMVYSGKIDQSEKNFIFDTYNIREYKYIKINTDGYKINVEGIR